MRTEGQGGLVRMRHKTRQELVDACRQLQACMWLGSREERAKTGGWHLDGGVYCVRLEGFAISYQALFVLFCASARQYLAFGPVCTATWPNIGIWSIVTRPLGPYRTIRNLRHESESHR